MLCCTFAGHRDVLHKGLEEAVERELSGLMEKETEFCFYVGSDGEFDALCARVIRRLKQQRTEKHIRLTLVEPYMKQSVNDNGKWLAERYDDIIIPMELMGVHYKSAIKRRNQWMIDHSQYMIAYVRRDHGGAFTAVEYAQRHGLNVIHV